MKAILKLSTLALCLMSTTALADVISIDPNYDGDTTDATELFENIESTDFNATSYYVDGDGDGTISTGEFVFDFGMNIGINALDDLNVTDSSGFNDTWDLVANYLIYGEAVVLENTANLDPVTLAALQPGYTPNGEYDEFGNYNLFNQPLEALGANIMDGMINLFYDTNADGTGDVLAASYDVSGVIIDNSGVNLTMFADGIYALDGFFYTSWGEELNDAIAGGAMWSAELVSTVETSGQFGEGSVPGTYNPNNEAIETTVDGVDVAYFGKTAKQITTSENSDCINDLTFGNAGCNATVPFSPVTEKWREIRDTIRAVAGTQDILARQTTLNATFSQNVSEPTSIAILGLGILGFAGLSRSRRS